MRRIPTPGWARPPEVDIDGAGGQEAHDALAPQSDAILRRVGQEVQRYIDDDDLTFETDDEDAFPARSRLTGEYYIGSQYYSLRQDRKGRAYYYLMIEARCLEKAWLENQEEFDYLGLTVGLMVWRDTGEIDLSGVDSAVI
jgi:hypothetical protein